MILPPSFVPDESVLTGIGASFGIAIGPARVYDHKKRHIPCRRLTGPDMADGEIKRLEAARELIRRRLTASKEALPPELQAQAAIIDAHLLLLDDPIFIQSSNAQISQEGWNAEQSVLISIEKISAILRRVQDAYISARMADVEMLGHAVIDALMDSDADDMPKAPPGSILVVHDISPTEVARIAAAKIAGLAAESGGHTSHTAIVAQAMELPAVVGVKGLTADINNGDLIIIDGRAGHVIVRPAPDALNFYRARQQMEKAVNAEIVRCAHLPAITLDEKRIEVLANLELMEEVPAMLSYGGEGIGLYRTEFMYLTRETLPAEDELYETYRRVVEVAAPYPVTIRTLDVGYDKAMPLINLQDNALMAPPGQCRRQALGLRGIRFSLRHQGLFKTQLRALLRVAVHGDVRIMLPMISSLDELRRSRAMIADAARSLAADGLAHNPAPPLGVMIEVPATIFLARELAAEADFFSVGTNDLIQYSLAVDRGDPEVSDMYQPLHPGILRMLKTILETGAETGTPVSVCGDMAAGLVTAPILIGLGASILSMPPAVIPKIKRVIRMASFAELQQWANEAMAAHTASEAAGAATNKIRQKFPEFF
ncbi:MAG: phosphoenolpyruvate--protein phosphotransferase [Candidatus Adiutrix sp.]|jgi:phosphotransferase system enzyme I (PtsI)|nr:phosphoenolpyruvate--protein phosphotransferase [Candidatus Adiutrix sp.]